MASEYLMDSKNMTRRLRDEALIRQDTFITWELMHESGDTVVADLEMSTSMKILNGVVVCWF